MTTLQSLQKEARSRFYQSFHLHPGFTWEQFEFLDEIIQSAYLAGRRDAVEYIDSKIEDSRYISNGEWESLLEEARNEE